MRKKTSYILFSFLIAACNNNAAETKPQNIVDEATMIDLIIDLQVLESHFQRSFHSPALYKNALTNSSQVIFDKYHVRKEQFDSSYEYYSLHIDAFYKIYESALDSLNFSSND